MRSRKKTAAGGWTVALAAGLFAAASCGCRSAPAERIPPPAANAAPPPPPPRYRVTDLGVLPGGAASSASAINDRGQIIGESETGRKNRAGRPLERTFLWEQGKMRELGTPDVFGRAINDRGQIAGWGLDRRAFFCDGKVHDLSVLHRDMGAFVLDLNNSGRIVGRGGSAELRVSDRALLWERYDRPPRDLGTLGGLSGGAQAINDKGQIVGDASTRGAGPLERLPGVPYSWRGESHAFLWENGKMRDLGLLHPSHRWSEAVDINEAGQVIGRSYYQPRSLPWQPRGFIWENGGMRDLGRLPGQPPGQTMIFPEALNDRGQVVGGTVEWKPGKAWVAGSDTHRAFLWQNGRMVDLHDQIPEDSGWVLRNATDINNGGEIVGSGIYKGRTRAFLLTPTDR